MSGWIAPAAEIATGSLALLGIGSLVVKWIGKVLRRLVGETVDEKLDAKLTVVQETVAARFDANDQATTDAVEMIQQVREEQANVAVDLARQFGGNGGGIRQAINELSAGLARLSGAFDQHVLEAKEKT